MWEGFGFARQPQFELNNVASRQGLTAAGGQQRHWDRSSLYLDACKNIYSHKCRRVAFCISQLVRRHSSQLNWHNPPQASWTTFKPMHHAPSEASWLHRKARYMSSLVSPPETTNGLPPSAIMNLQDVQINLVDVFSSHQKQHTQDRQD